MANVPSQGLTSFYGPGLYGNRTSNGTILRQNTLGVAHRTLPFGTKILFTNPNNGKSIVLEVIDRGPFKGGRVYDVTEAAAKYLGITGAGVVTLQSKEVSPNTIVGPVSTSSTSPTSTSRTQAQPKSESQQIQEFIDKYAGKQIPRITAPIGSDPSHKYAIAINTNGTYQIIDLNTNKYITSPKRLTIDDVRDFTIYTNTSIDRSTNIENLIQESPATPEPINYQDKEWSNAEIKDLFDSVRSAEETLKKFKISDTETLLDRIKQSGVTPELLQEFPDLAETIIFYYDNRDKVKEILAEIRKKCGVTLQDSTSWSKQQDTCLKAYNYTQLKNIESEIEKNRVDMPNPCGESTLSSINNALLNFFQTLKTIKKYYNVYVNGTINKIQSITSLISRTSQIIASVLKLLVQRMRNYVLNLLRKLIEKVIDKILTKLGKALKNTFLKAIVDALICKFNDIIKGLRNLVVDFLYAMIGNVINMPICAVEQFTNTLINSMSAKIDKDLQPILSSINDILGGVAQIGGKIFEAVNFILGFEAFLCAKPKCPEIKSWIPGTGVTPSAIKDFQNNFLPIPNADQIEETILGGTKDAIGSLLPGISIFGDPRIEGNVLARGTPPAGVQCFPGASRCGPPKVEFFGGGGAGAIGNAVVNSIGEVVGVDLFYGGRGYTAPPFVTFQDTCDNGGSGASAYTVTNDEGEVIQVIMVNNGANYLNAPSGLTEFDQPSEQLLPNEEVITREYVTCLDEIQILDTGIGYLPTDTVSITPDVSGLQVKVQITEIGQIVGMEVLSSGCGFNEVPEIRINSDTGAGLKVRPVMRFVNRDQYFKEQPDFDSTKLVKVIDCVLK
jgi:arsenate reductase-like glutaredoxin family protein